MMFRFDLKVLLLLAGLGTVGCKQAAPAATPTPTPKVAATQVPVPRPAPRKFTAAQMKEAMVRQYATMDRALHVRDSELLLSVCSAHYKEKGKRLNRAQLKQEIEKQFAEALKMENEIGAIDIRNPVKILKVTPLGPTRCKVRYRHTRTEEAYQLRFEKESETTDIWQFEDDEEWRLVEEVSDRALRHQKFVNGRLKENLPLDE